MWSYYSIMILVVDLVCIWLRGMMFFFKDTIFSKYKSHLKKQKNTCFLDKF